MTTRMLAVVMPAIISISALHPHVHPCHWHHFCAESFPILTGASRQKKTTQWLGAPRKAESPWDSKHPSKPGFFKPTRLPFPAAPGARRAKFKPGVGAISGPGSDPDRSIVSGCSGVPGCRYHSRWYPQIWAHDKVSPNNDTSRNVRKDGSGPTDEQQQVRTLQRFLKASVTNLPYAFSCCC